MSVVGHDLRHGLGIARVELRRSVRKSFGTRKRQLAVLGFLTMFAPVLFFWGQTAYGAGEAAARSGTLPLETLGVQLSLLVLVFVVMGALRVVQQGRPEGDALLLTATTPRAVLVGITTHATVQLVGFAMLPTVLFAGAFALGAGQPTILLSAVLALTPLLVAVSMLGTVVGQLALLGMLWSRGFRSASRAFGGLLVLVLLALSYAAMAPVVGVTGPLEAVATFTSPATHYLAFVFVGTSLGPDVGVSALLVATVVLASVPVLFLVADRLAPRLWFADATPASLVRRDEAAATETAAGVGEAGFPPQTGPRSLSVALGLWRRWVRLPVRFSPLFPLVIIFVVSLFGVVNTPGQLPLVVGGALVFAGVYAGGAVFGLNPLGEAGEMRTLEYLSPTPARTLVAGHVLAGLLLGAPLTLVGTGLLAASTGLSLPVTLGLCVLGVVLVTVGGSVAVGIGSVLPSRDARRTYRGYEVASPSQWALVAYMLAAVVLTAVAAGGALLLLLSFDAGTGSTLTVAGLGVVVAFLLGLGYGGARTAVGQFERAPYAHLGGESPSRRSRTASADDTTGTLRATSLTRTQQVRGLVLLGTFVVVRAVVARGWDRYFPGGYSTDPLFLASLGGTFLLLSVGLVYLGFTRWVGVDLRAWWVDRARLRGDLVWGVLGAVAVFLVTIGGALALTTVFPGLNPAGATGAAPASTATGAGGAATGLVVNLLLGLFFGFAIAAFQEETLFRGFLQRLLEERYGRLLAIVGQAAVFTLAHLGYYPVSAWPLLFVVFLVGIVTGVLVDRRGTLLPAGLAHGFVG
jgi:membrane protease YdiL (CAAX protease family)/Na+-transporting methylmalonyl-CoA/oxaloacetate decarboxylase gamma subunit